jgi:5'-methylthioadenosine phosphorylase
MRQISVGVIGGTGLYQIEGLADIEEVNPDTPFGKPSDTIVTGRLEGIGIAFLPRHGKGHRLLPGELPSRANIYALKSLGVEQIIAICSAGSFKEELAPGHLVIPDQLIDRTRGRVSTYFGEGVVAHVAFGEPFCPRLSAVLYEAGREVGAPIHPSGTMVVMEGPAFSTRAESRLYKSWGADIIGMTALPEAKLAREAEICYAVVGCITDYDSWHQQRDAVTVDVILSTLARNVDTAKRIIRLAAARMSGLRDCACATALETALVTAPDAVPGAQKKKLELLLRKYWGQQHD